MVSHVYDSEIDYWNRTLDWVVFLFGQVSVYIFRSLFFIIDKKLATIDECNNDNGIYCSVFIKILLAITLCKVGYGHYATANVFECIIVESYNHELFHLIQFAIWDNYM